MYYKVLKDFTDFGDKHIYRAGDEFPRVGAKANEKRIAELSTCQNRRGEVLIAAIEEESGKNGFDVKINKKPSVKRRGKKNAGTNPSDD